MDKFIDIKGYEGLYAINENGEVWSYRRNKILRHRRNNTGYAQVGLSKNGKQKLFLVHRLIAETFVLNPNNYKLVEFIDKNSANLRADNLRWAAVPHGAKVMCEETGEVFPSIAAARAATGASHICDCLCGKFSRSGGLHWKKVRE